MSKKGETMRRALLKVTPKLLGSALYNGEHHFRTTSGLPPDAKFISSWWDPETNCYNLCFESKSFSDVPEGAKMPYLHPPEITIIEKEKPDE